MSFGYDDRLAPCPICGKKAYVMHIYDVYDRAEYGWDAGCPSFKLYDGVHGADEDTPASDFPRVSSCITKEQAIEAWNRWVDRWKERHDVL